MSAGSSIFSVVNEGVEKMKAIRRISLHVLIAISAISQAYGQLTTATVTGTVTDASGAAIPSAALTLVNLSRGATRTAVADAAGRFFLTSSKWGAID